MSVISDYARANLSDDVIHQVKDLARVNIDSSNGFTEAADDVECTAMKSFFREQAAQRSQNAAELQDIVEINGEEAPVEGSLLASFHRTWIQVRAAVTSRDEVAVLSEAERGEDYIKQMYEDAMKKTAGTPVNEVISRQYANVKLGHDTVRDLRDSKKRSCK